MSRLKGIIFAVIGLTVMAASIWNGLFRHAYFENYTTTITRALGPTSLSGKRGTLPQPSPTNLNAIFVEGENGSDSNPGTLAQPVQTIDVANTKLGGLLTTIVILEAPSFPGFGYTFGGPFTLASGRNIQAADGVFGSVLMSGTITLAGTNNINGFYASNTNGDPLTISGTAITMGNIGVYSTSTRTFGTILDATGVAQVTLTSCIIGSYGMANAAGTTNVDFVTCAIISTDPVNRAACFRNTMTTGTTTNVTFTRCFLYASGIGSLGGQSFSNPIIYVNGTAGTYTFNIDYASCYISCPGNMYFVSATGTTTLTSDLSYCLAAANHTYTLSTSPAGTTPTFTATNVNAINPTTPPLFTDLLPAITIPLFDGSGNFAALYQDFMDMAYGISLQAEGKATINGAGIYLLDSPLIGAGSGGVDVNPWTESAALSSTGYAKETTIVYPAASYKRITKLTNPVNIYDVNGNLHTSYDTTRNGFEFTFGNSRFSLADDLRNLITVLQDNGSVEFIPKDSDGNNLFINEVSNITTGTFDAATNKFYMITSATDVELIDNNWRGFVCTLVIAAVPTDFYIESNDFESFTLVDKYGNGFPISGDYTFSVDKILVTAEKQDLEAATEYVTNFERGQGWREGGRSPVPDSNEFVPGGHTIRLWEIEDPTTGG